VVATCHKLDQDRRDICQLGVGNTDVGLELLRRGLAWVLMRYAHELPDERRASYLDAQAQAKSARIGLWSADVTPMPPWEWRGSGRRLPGEGVAMPAAPPANAW
jgi:endonuclease YncB( thermonuclease family)